MGEHEVTQEEYLAVTGSNPSGFTGDLKRPVETVCWNDAVNYCSDADDERAGGGADTGSVGISAADGGGMGVCVPGWGDDDALQLWG